MRPWRTLFIDRSNMRCAKSNLTGNFFAISRLASEGVAEKRKDDEDEDESPRKPYCQTWSRIQIASSSGGDGPRTEDLSPIAGC